MTDHTRSSKMKWDALVIGAGHNGLTAAAYLAKAGLKVLVVEARNHIGGMAATIPVDDGFKISECAHLLYGLHPQVIKDLGLYKSGLEFTHRRIETVALDADDDHAVFSPDVLQTKTSLAKHSAHDAEAYAPFLKRLLRLAGAIQPWLTSDPTAQWQEKGSSALRPAIQAVRRLRDEDVRELVYASQASVATIMETVFESRLLKGALAVDAVLGTSLPPTAPGSVLNWLYRLSGECSGIKGAIGHPRGGLGGVSDAIWATAHERGAELLLGKRVSSIVFGSDRAEGVELDDGSVIKTRAVFSSLDPVATYMGLVGERNLDVGFAGRIKRWRAKGMTARVAVTLDGCPEFRNLGADQMGNRFLIAPDLDHIDASYRPAKRGAFGEYPMMELVVPTIHDPSLAPPGKHVLSVLVQYVPYVTGPENDALRERLGAVVLNRLGYYSANLKKITRQTYIWTPADIERDFGATGGHWHHGELALDQLWSLRPTPLSLFGEAPAKGIYLCGAGTHPGGGVTGACGYNAARRHLATEGLI